MNQVKLQFGESVITVQHQGAHLGSWVYQGKEQLFLSRKAIYKPAKALRGGVPICFPQFGAFGPGNSHGFARNVLWQQISSGCDHRLLFELNSNDESLKQWPYEFKAQLDVEIKKSALRMCLSVENLSSEKMEFTAALHTYFRVDDIKNVIVDGLHENQYWDNGTPFSQRQSQQQAQLRVDQMIDRVYFNTPKTLELIDGQSSREITSSGFDDTVIWNPWGKGAQAFVDMADDEYQQMLCIESANVQTPAKLEPGGVWQGVQQIVVKGKLTGKLNLEQ